MPLPPNVPDLVSLDLFCSVVELGSLGRAAEAHGISQPSASARIQVLEQRLGVRVLERGPNGSRPTDEGVLLAEWAQSVLIAAADLVDGVATLRREASTVLRVAASNTVAEFLLPGWLVEWRRGEPAHDRVGVELEVTNSAGVLAAVGAGTVGVGFIESPGGIDGPGPRLGERHLRDDELVVVAAPTHRWARRRRAIGPDELAAEPLVAREAGSGTRDALASALATARRVSAAPLLELGSTTAVVGAVAGGAGPAVVSGLAVAHDLAAGRLVRIEVAGLDLRRPLRAVWRGARPPDGAASALVELAGR